MYWHLHWYLSIYYPLSLLLLPMDALDRAYVDRTALDFVFAGAAGVEAFGFPIVGIAKYSR